MTARRICLVLLVAWAGFVALAFYRFITLAPSDFGLTAGFNRIEAFIGWQLAAIVMAVPLWLIGRGLRPGLLRTVTRVPAFWALLLVLAVSALIGWAWVQHAMYPPEAHGPPGQATEPVTVPVGTRPVTGAPELGD